MLRFKKAAIHAAYVLRMDLLTFFLCSSVSLVVVSQEVLSVFILVKR